MRAPVGCQEVVCVHAAAVCGGGSGGNLSPLYLVQCLVREGQQYCMSLLTVLLCLAVLRPLCASAPHLSTGG